MNLLRIDNPGAEWRALRAIAMAAIRHRTSLGGNGLSEFCLALALVIPPLAGGLSGRWGLSVGLGAGVPLALLALMWWALLLPAIARQNHDASKLVPDFAGRSLRLVALIFVLFATVLTGLFACAGASVLPTLVSVCTMMIFFATFVVFPRLAYLVWAVMLMAVVVSWFAPGLPERVLSTDRLCTAAAVYCVVVGYILMRRLARGPWPMPGQVQPRPVAGGRAAGRATTHALQRDCASGDIAGLLLHALGPTPRLERFWLIGAACVGAAGVVAGVLGVFDGKPALHPMAALVLFAPLLQAIVPHGMVWAFRHSHAEQALLRLAPRAPGAAAMNTVLARALLARLAACWAIISVLTLALTFGLGASVTEVLRLLPGCFLGIGASALALRDYAADKGGSTDVLSACALWLLPAAALQFAALSGRLDDATWWMIGAAALLAGAAWARHCWLRMVRAPAAFPAGRMAR